MADRSSFAKKIILLAALLLVFGSSVALAAKTVITPAEFFTFVKVEGGVEITGYRGEGLDYVVVPDILGEQTVVAIGTGAFWGNSDIVSVALPLSISSIGNNAFTDCMRLTNFSGESVAHIGDYAFYGCNELAKVTLSGYCDTVGVESFGSAVPVLSVSSSYNIDQLLSVQQLVNKSGGAVQLGRVGYFQVNQEMLALNSSLVQLLDETISTDADKLWEADLVTIESLDGSVYTTSFADFYAKLRSTGLYSAIGALNRVKLETRLDTMLDGLLADAKRLQ